MSSNNGKALSFVEELFDEHFYGLPDARAVAPGRLNLIGEHTDYNDGFVFPVAIDLQVWICARKTGGPTKMISSEMGPALEFDANHVSPGDLVGWGAFGGGIAWALREWLGQPMPNLEIAVHGEVPIGSGVSSSAAIELALGVVWNRIGNFGLDNKELALIGQTCENKFVGVQSGIMDQMASAMGKRGKAMFLDTRSLTITYAEVPQELTVAICDTGKKRSLTNSAYNERRAECERACRELGVKALRDATLEQLDAHKQSMDQVAYKRAKHVISEDARCEEFVDALDGNDFPAIGLLMRSSHESLRDDFEVSCPELDAMAESAWAAEGCVGARMTGAGFGGACVALVRSEQIADFVACTALAYNKKTSLGGNFMVCSVADGAHTLS